MFKNEVLGGKLKPAGYQIAYTEEQMYVEIPRCMADPVYFIETYCWIISTKGRMLFNLYDYQKDLIHHYHSHERTVTLLARQCGKCFFATTSLYSNGEKIIASSLIKHTMKEKVVKWIEGLLVGLVLYVKSGSSETEKQ